LRESGSAASTGGESSRSRARGRVSTFCSSAPQNVAIVRCARVRATFSTHTVENVAPRGAGRESATFSRFGPAKRRNRAVRASPCDVLWALGDKRRTRRAHAPDCDVLQPRAPDRAAPALPARPSPFPQCRRSRAPSPPPASRQGARPLPQCRRSPAPQPTAQRRAPRPRPAGQPAANHSSSSERGSLSPAGRRSLRFRRGRAPWPSARPTAGRQAPQ
jgi:hypothetical protein